MAVREKSSLIGSVVLVLCTMVMGLLTSDEAVYAAGGGWIGTGSSSSGGGGGAQGGANCYGDDGKYIVDCTGVSWIFYEYKGGSSHAGEPISFVPKNGTEGPISGECANTNEGAGFWHFGVNGKGFNYGGYADYDYLKSYEGLWNGNTYEGQSGYWGHMSTRPFSFMGGGNNGVYYKAQWPLFQEIYSPNGDLMYSAKTMALDSWDGNLINAYRAARESATGSPYSGGIPGETYAFCYWPGMEIPSVTIKYVGQQEGCYGMEGSETELGTDGPIKDEDRDGTISAHARVSDFENQGWAFKSIDGAVLDGNGNMTVDVSNGSKTVTVYFTRPGNCDIDCNAWTPQSYMNSNEFNGTTSVVIAAQNQSLTNANSQWHHMTTENNKIAYGHIYAKPTDDVQWKYCFYPGVERTAFGTVTKGNIDPEPGEMHPNTNHLDNMEFYRAIITGWSSAFKAWTTNLKPSPNADVSKEGSKAVGDDWPLTGTLPESDPYGVQPTPQPTIDLSLNNVKNRLDPGTTLLGQIQTTGTLTGAQRWAGQNHSWQCNPYPCPYPCGEDNKETCWRTCHDTCSHDNQFFRNEINPNPTSDNADVLVPYNFENTAAVKIQNDLLYAGETATINGAVENTNVKVNTRQNDETQGNYATQVPGAKLRLIGYISGQDDSGRAEQRGVGYGISDTSGLCQFLGVKWSLGDCAELDSDDGDRNPKANMDGETYEPKWKGQTYNVWDEAAGNYFCVAAAVWPYTVRDDREMDASGSNNWYISQPSCVILAKRPIFQVWGAGVYAAGDIETNIPSTKNNVKNFVAWHPTLPNQEVLFTSFGELGVTLEGSTKDMASGASTGYRGGSPAWDSSGGLGTGSPGGWDDNDQNICLRTPLTFANQNCGSGSVGGFKATVVREGILSDKSAMIDRLALEGEISHDGFTVESLRGWNDLYEESVPRGTTIINIANGTINIHGNIYYGNGSGAYYNDRSYTTLNDIPKYIIYAKGGNINIDCIVTRLDAILIADGEVNTCGSGQVGSPARDGANSHQLIVNGAIVTGSLTLNRSYGSAAGGNSINPAELVNYDSSIYLWANRSASSGNSGDFVEATTRELAPRR